MDSTFKFVIKLWLKHTKEKKIWTGGKLAQIYSCHSYKFLSFHLAHGISGPTNNLEQKTFHNNINHQISFSSEQI